MTTTKRLTQRKAFPVFGFKAVDGAPDGTFEAYVSVFSNVDLDAERVMPGAFKGSLAQWAASGDPIPVIFSHQWDNLDAHVGAVLEAEERLAGDARLPTELAALGGLWVKAQMDLSEDFAARLWKRMSKRLIKEFSFAYDILKAKPGGDGAKLDLLELELIEVGPTLKGANPDTVLVNAKAAAERGLSPLDVLELVDSLDLEHVGAPKSAPDPPATPAGAKRLPGGSLTGTIEDELAAVRAAAEVWAGVEYGRDLYYLHLEGTFLTEGRAVVTAERWEDPLGEGPVFELAFTLNDDGTVTIDDATELELTVELAAKRATRNALASLHRAGKSTANTPTGKAEDRSGGKADDQRGSTNVDLASLEADLVSIDAG